MMNLRLVAGPRQGIRRAIVPESRFSAMRNENYVGVQFVPTQDYDKATPMAAANNPFPNPGPTIIENVSGAPWMLRTRCAATRASG